MNPDELSPIEALLRRQPLRQPSRRLDERMAAVGRTAAATVARRRRQRFALGVAVAAAAALMVMINYSWHHDSTLAQRGPEMRPAVEIERVQVVLSAGGVVTSAQGTPMQRVERQIVRDVQWIDKEKHVRIEWKIPSADSLLVPLEYN